MSREFDVARLRAYALGEGYFSTRGVDRAEPVDVLRARFQVAQPTLTFDPNDPTSRSVTRSLRRSRRGSIAAASSRARAGPR